MAEDHKTSTDENERLPSPILPHDSVAGSALISVIAIMSFLAALTWGAVQIVHSKTAEWRADAAREVTIQVRPVEGGNLENDVRKVVEIAKKNPIVIEARAYSKEESEKLLEPWLGGGIDLGSLPVPRLIRVRIQSVAGNDLAGLRRSLSENISNATLDDHRSWTERIASASSAVTFAGIVALVLMLIATVLSVSFATRGAVAANHATVEVLHFIGARDSYVADEFQRHFLILGLKGGAIGVAAAVLSFLILRLTGGLIGTPPGGGTASFLGQMSLSWLGYLGMGGIAILVAIIAAIGSRLTVHRTLRTID